MTDPLENLCDQCEGKGGHQPQYCPWSDCFECDGSGHVPTEFGKQVLALIQHNLVITDLGEVKWRNEQ